MNIIFVCTGNTCRSPMAEYYLKSKNIDNLNVISRGFSGGDIANKNAATVMQECGIDIDTHVSKIITLKEANNADAIICMTHQHKQMLMLSGVNANLISVLGNEIPDPFGFEIDTYRECRDMIFHEIDSLIANGFFNDITLRYALPSDADAIAIIEKECFSTPWSKKAILESMDAGTFFYVATSNDKIVGYMGISKIAGEGYVTNIAVLPNYRRNGIGEKILQHVIKDSKQLDFISLEVRVSNSAAISLYEKLGFEKVGCRKRFYDNPQEDALIMTKNFGD